MSMQGILTEKVDFTVVLLIKVSCLVKKEKAADPDLLNQGGLQYRSFPFSKDSLVNESNLSLSVSVSTFWPQ
jgi:hypothetical protein